MVEESKLRATPMIGRSLSAFVLAVLLLFGSGSLAQEPEPRSVESVVPATTPSTSDREPNPEPSSEAQSVSKSAEDTDGQSAEEEHGAVESGSPTGEKSALQGEPLVETQAPPGWAQRVIDLEEAIDRGMSSSEAADELYAELAPELWREQEAVYQALRDRSGDVFDRREKLAEMYAARLRLLDLVSPSQRARRLGSGATSLREIGREFSKARLDFFFQTLTIPRGIRQIADDFRESPVDVFWRLLQLIFGIVVFRTWRRWAKTGLPEARRKVLAVRPSTDVQLNVARGLWYLDRFRGPLEWLALLFFVSAIFEPRDLEEVAGLVWIILLWMLLTRFGLLLVDALASRGATGRHAQVPALRLRSLRLVAAWILLTGLGLDLTSRYVGEAAIHAWVSRVFYLLLWPTGFLLLYWWRPEILKRVKEASSFSDTARRIGTEMGGVKSYVNALAGMVYVIGAYGLQLFIRIAARFEGGRRIVATLLRREVERDAQRQHVADQRISRDLEFELLTADETLIDAPYREALDRVKGIAEAGRSGTVGVLAERGGGLRTFLGLLEDEIGSTMRVVDCPPGGPNKFMEALAASFDLAADADLEERLRPRMEEQGVRIVAVNNYHRVARPMRGGLAGIERASELAGAAGEDILWIVTLTRASWPYISRLLGDRAILHEVLELPSWSEEQLGELIDARCKKAGIAPDYRQLDFPRQFDDGEGATLEQRNRAGFHRILWELSDGNPEVAIRLFTDSVREQPGGGIVVRLPNPASTAKIAASNLTTMLILKVLVETELATVDELVASIRESRETVTNALAACLAEGWVEEVYDHYQVTWAAYRRVKRVLVRRGLIAR